jgi:hypothetical protein
MDMVLDLLPNLLLMLISFACGYGLRECISWRRHAATRKNSFQKDSESRSRQPRIIEPTIMTHSKFRQR